MITKSQKYRLNQLIKHYSDTLLMSQAEVDYSNKLLDLNETIEQRVTKAREALGRYIEYLAKPKE